MQTAVPAVPSQETIHRALGEFQLLVTDDQVLQIQRYMKLLLAWNDRVNLTAIRDPLEILYRHFCESMYAGCAIPVEKGRLADAGSGGGFPGIPLKIFKPEIELFLVESNVKKATFLAEVIRDIGLTGARVLVSRYEELAEEVTPLDYACSRALGDFPGFLSWASSPRIAAKSVILWVGSRDVDEVRKIGSWTWREPIPVPQSLRRYLLVGSGGETLAEAK
jgi:16S rRNA (guanine527-N7)-methyltransferase